MSNKAESDFRVCLAYIGGWASAALTLWLWLEATGGL
jgi:hypothetical protein